MNSALEEEAAEARTRNLRFCIAYWELAMQLPVEGDDDESDAAWKRRLFREELESFHHLVVNNVTHEGVMTHARESLRLVWNDCERGVANENWARTEPEDVRVAVLNDLQLVAPGIWIGSTDSLTDSKLLDEREIQHTVYCTTTKQETQLTRELTSISPPRTHRVVDLFELPRRQFEDLLKQDDSFEQLKGLSSSSCNELSCIASALSDLIGSHAILLYCDSGISTSIAVCAALLMTRYKLPLKIVMPLIQAARRDVLPSKHLRFQLEQLELNQSPGLQS